MVRAMMRLRRVVYYHAADCVWFPVHEELEEVMGLDQWDVISMQ